MENEAIKQEIDTLIIELGEDVTIARPTAERAVIEKIRIFLENTRDQRTGSCRQEWEQYLPYAARRCFRLSKVEEGWEDELAYFASENAQFWVDNAGSSLESGDIESAKNALGLISDAIRMLKQDRIAQVDILLQALDYAVEISDKKRSILLFEEAENLYRKYLAGGHEYAGSAWLPRIKKMGQKLSRFQEQLRRYYQYSESITVGLEAESEADLIRVVEYLQQNLTGKIKVIRRVKEEKEQGQSGAKRFKTRLKITLES